MGPRLQHRRIIRSTTDSLSRLAEAKTEVAAGLRTEPVAKHVKNLTKPNSVSKTMRNVGVALIASPDIITDPVGAALVAGSYVMKSRDPIKLDDLAVETRKILRDIQSLRL